MTDPTGKRTASRTGARPNDIRFAERANDLAAFVAEHGRMPQFASDPRRKNEYALASWLRGCRESDRGKEGYGNWSPEREALLNRLVPQWRRPTGPSWFTGHRSDIRFAFRVAELEAFVADHGRMPRSKPSSRTRRDEPALGSWLNDARTANQSPDLTSDARLSAERRAMLDERVPGWDVLGTPENAFSTHLDDLVAYVRRHDRLPTVSFARNMDDRDGVKLARWLENCRRAARGSADGSFTLSEDRVRLLDGRVPGWNATDVRDEVFDQRLDEADDFVRTHGRLPGQSDDGSGRVLAPWLQSLRRAARGQAGGARWTPERLAALDERLPGWNSLGSRDERFAAHIRDLADYVAVHGCLPTIRSCQKANDRKGERTARWLQRCRNSARNSARSNACGSARSGAVMTSEQVRALDDAVPQWRERAVTFKPGREDAFESRVEQVASFISRNARWPNHYSDDPEEQSMDRWLRRMRAANRSVGTDNFASKWSAERAEMMDRLLPGWQTDHPHRRRVRRS